MPSCILHTWKSLWRCMGNSSWLRMEPRAKPSPRWQIKNTTLVFAVVPSDHEVSKRPLSDGFFQPFPQCRILKLAQSQTLNIVPKVKVTQTWEETLSSTVVKNDLVSPPRCSIYSCGWQNAPSVSHKVILATANLSQILRYNSKTYKNSITQIPFPNYSDYMLK